MAGPGLFKRDDSLGGLTEPEGSLVTGRVDENGAIWVNTGGAGGAGDASAANQDEQTALLTTMDADTGALVTHLVTLLAALGTTNAVAAADAAGFPGMAIRDDALSALGVAEGDWAPLRVDANGALFVQLAGALSGSVDSISVGASATVGAAYTPSKQLDIDETEDEVKSTAGKVGGWVLTNLHTATVFVKFYNATAANVTVGSTAPHFTIAIPASTGVVMPLGGPGIAFSTAISVAATLDEADADATAIPSANLVVGTIFYV